MKQISMTRKTYSIGKVAQGLAVFIVSLLLTMPHARAAEYKIGFINTEKVFREAAPAQRAQKKLEKEFAAREQELQKMTKHAKELQTYLEREAVTTNETERRNKERELSNLNRDFQRLQRDYREDWNRRRNEELAALQDRANKIINAIAESEKFDLILQEAVFVSSRVDITDRVIKALSEKEK